MNAATIERKRAEHRRLSGSVAAFVILALSVALLDAQPTNLPLHRLLSAPYTTNEAYTLRFEADGARQSRAVTLAMGNNQVMVSVTNGGGQVFPLVFEIVRVESMSDRTFIGYDLLDNPEWVTNALGQVTHFRHDGLGRLVEVNGPNTNEFARYTYDGNDNLIGMEDPTGVTSYVYDELDRVIEIISARGRGSIRYTYDLAGRVTSITYPNGTLVVYGYNAAGRLETVAQGADLTTYRYYSDGLLKSVALPNGITGSYSYDNFTRLTDLVYTNVAGLLVTSFHYVMDKNGNRIRVDVRRQDLSKPELLDIVTNVYSYAYDQRNELIRAEYPDGSVVDYSYDANGNRLRRSIDPDGSGPKASVVELYHYGIENRLDRITNTNGVTLGEFFYDSRGNQVAQVTTNRTIRCEFDFQNRLVRIDDGTTITDFDYDGNGERVSKTVNGRRTFYINDSTQNFTQVLLETDERGDVSATHCYGLGRICYSASSQDSVSYYLDDAIGSTVAITDTRGIVIQSYGYEAFGLPRLTKSTAGTQLRSTFLFAGEDFEADPGLIYLRARYFDPFTGRFVSKDPAGFVNGPNDYIFVGNNPVNRVDPSGTNWEEWFRRISDISTVSEYASKWAQQALFKISQNLPWRVVTKDYLTGGFGFQLTKNLWNARRTAITAGEVLGRVNIVFGFAEAVLELRSYTDLSQRWAGGRASTFDLVVGAERLILKAALAPIGGTWAVDYGTKFGDWAFRQTQWLQWDKLDPSFQNPFRLDTFRLDPSFLNPFRVTSSYADTVSDYRINGGFNRGGVLLNRAVNFVGDLSAITGATVDPQTGQIILLGTNGAGGTVPDLRLDDFVSAVRAVFGSAEDPGVTIDPQPGFEGNPAVAQVVHLFSGLENTDTGWVLMEADRVMKTLAAEKDNVLDFPVSSSVSGYKSMLQRWIDSAQGDGSPRLARFWFVPSDVRLVRSPETNSFVFDRTAVQLLTESMFMGQGVTDTNAEAFARWFTTNYAAIADEEFAVYKYPDEGVSADGPYSLKIFQRLEQVAKAIAIARFLYDNRIPIDFSWVENVELPKVNTPRFVKTVQNSRTAEVEGGVITVTITGGVSLETPNSYLFDNGIASDLRTNVLSSRPDPLAQRWTVNFNGQNQTAVALSLDTRHVDGLDARADSDLAYQSVGDVPFGLTRYYRSSAPMRGSFGFGWEFVPFDLDFARPEFYSSSRSLFTFLNGLHEGEVRVVDRASGRVVTFVSSLETDRLAGFFLYGGLNQNDVPDFAPGGSEHPDGSTLTQDPVTLGYRFSRPDGLKVDFDSKGRMLRASDPRGRAVTYGYNTNGLVTAITDASGQSITLRYDASNRVAQAGGISGDTVAYTYDSAGDLVSATRLRQGEPITYTYHYDADHRLSTVMMPDQVIDSMTLLDIMGRATMRRDVRGNEFHSNFDQTTGTTVTTDMTNGVQTVRERDFLGRPTVLIDQLGRQTRYCYFSFTRRQPDVVELPNPARPLIRLEYDANGNLIEIGDPARGGDLDGNGLDDNPIVLTYDANNNLAESRDARGIITRFTYNQFNQRTSMTRAFGTPRQATTRWEYDPSTGFLLSQTDPTGVVTEFEYDALGNLVRQTVAPGTLAETTTRFTYDAFSRRTSQQDGAGRATRYVFNGRDQISTVALETPAPLISSNIYDVATGRLLAEVDFNGNTNRFTYDPNTGDLVRVAESGAITELRYDRFGNIASITDPIGNVTEFSYDVVQRQTAIISRALDLLPMPPVEITTVTVSGTNLAFTVVTTNLTSNVVIEQTDNLTPPRWTPVTGLTITPIGTGRFAVVIPRPPSPQKFYRASVSVIAAAGGAHLEAGLRARRAPD